MPGTNEDNEYNEPNSYVDVGTDTDDSCGTERTENTESPFVIEQKMGERNARIAFVYLV